MDAALQLACSDGSSLTRSFWCGKFLQLLPEEEAVKYTQLFHFTGQSTSISTSEQTVAGALNQPITDEEDTIAATHPTHLRASSSSDGENLDPAIELVTGRPSKKEEGIVTRGDSRGDVHSQDFRRHILKALKCLKQCETSLSPNVHNLVVDSFHGQSAPADLVTSLSKSSFLLKDCTLDWDVVSLHLNSDGKDDACGARVCAVIAKKVFDEMTTDGSELSLVLEKKSNFDWTPSPQLFIDCIKELQSENPLRVNTGLLLGTAAFERALEDVYLKVSKAAQCPPLLRDLLGTADLETTFEKTEMHMLRCLIGPPSSLNLRNILWHGFVSPAEISQEYAYLFFVVVSSFGKKLQSTAPSLQLSHRRYITFLQESRLVNILTELCDSDLVAIEKLFSHSFFILPTMRQTWKSALHEYKRNRHGHCVALLLPCLEHSLRRVFACVNDCSERALTAESTNLYTTFDEILSPTLSNGRDNRLKDEIGVPKMEMLLDLLVHAEGPRVRDRISHGEVEFCKISKTIASHIVCVATLFCLHYGIGVEKHSDQVYKSLLAGEKEYASVFHPLSLLRRDLEKLISLLHNWRNIPIPDEVQSGSSRSDDQSQAKPGKQASTCDAAFRTFCGNFNLFLPLEASACEQLEKLIRTVWERPIKTLFVSKYTMEVTGIMRQTVENAITSVSQIHETASLRFKQYEEKQLRSRQRANYDHLLRSLHLYSNAMAVLVVLLVSVTSELDTQSSTRYLKKVLQFAENFKSQTSLSRNRWEEADKLCYSLATLANQLPVAPSFVHL